MERIQVGSFPDSIQVTGLKGGFPHARRLFMDLCGQQGTQTDLPQTREPAGRSGEHEAPRT